MKMATRFVETVTGKRFEEYSEVLFSSATNPNARDYKPRKTDLEAMVLPVEQGGNRRKKLLAVRRMN
jgi:hypothetical protein